MTRRLVVVLVAVGTAVVVLLGAGVYFTAEALFRKPPLAVAEDVVGDWRGADGATLTLNPDNTFVARELPVNVQAPDRYSTPFSGTGEWRLAAPDRYSTQNAFVIIDGFGIPLTVRKSDRQTRLFLNYDEVGEGRKFWLDRS